MQATVIGKNVDVKKIRRVIYDISMDIKFIEYHNTRKLQRPSSTWLNELSEVQTLEKAWKVD
jgi:dihydrodipicolinate reductase